MLGPILFLLFINDIEDCLSYSKIRCFADDSRLAKSVGSPSDAHLLQEDLDHVLEWAKHNNMSLNQDKTHSSYFACKIATMLNPISISKQTTW